MALDKSPEGFVRTPPSTASTEPRISWRERATIRAEKRRDTFGPTRMDDAVWADMQRLYPQHTKDIG
jgi:hypothetical protein